MDGLCDAGLGCMVGWCTRIFTLLAIGAYSWVNRQPEIRAPELIIRQSPKSGPDDIAEARRPTVEEVLRK